VFTREELRNIPLFSGLAERDLDHLAATSADIRLLPGEYVIHEGDSHRAFFITVEGHIEGTKFVNGVEQVIGVRQPGEPFGEVPVALDTVSPVSYRATEPSRVMRVDLRDFRVLPPQVVSTVTALALERVEGLQEIAASPASPIAVIAPEWDDTGRVLREFLQRNSVEFDAIVSQDGQEEALVRLRDGSFLVAPSIRDVANSIGLCVFPATREVDVAIVGGGPAGLAAAVYGASEGLNTILFEQEAPGGQAGTSSRIENYLGFPFGISGDELAHRALQQATRMGAQIVVTRTVESIDTNSRTLTLDGNDVIHAKTIVLATGVVWRQLDLASLDRLRDRGVYYGAAPGESRFVGGKDVYLVGGGNSAGQAAINFSNFANSVTLLVRSESLSSSMSQYLIDQLNTKPNVSIETCSEVIDAYGNDHLEGIVVSNKVTGESATRSTSALFILIGADAQTAWLPSTIQRDELGYVCTGLDAKRPEWPLERSPFMLETSVPGIFAVGDVRAGSIKRVASGVGEGSMAIAFVHRYLESY
jgi:thioredoxin reductase (NADPH)